MNDQIGAWPEKCLRRAFVEGAMWWQFHKSGSTPFASERDEAEEEAINRYGNQDDFSPPMPYNWIK